MNISEPEFIPEQKVYDLATENPLEGKTYRDAIYTISRCLYDFEQTRWFFTIKEDSEQEPYTAETFIKVEEN